MQQVDGIIGEGSEELYWKSIAPTSFINSSASQGPVDFILQNIWLRVTDHITVVIQFTKIFLVQFFCVFFPSFLYLLSVY